MSKCQNVHRSEWHQLEDLMEELLRRFAVNNLKTGNLGSLIQIFLSRQRELRSSLEDDSVLFSLQTFNALFILRTIFKFLIERLKEDEVLRQIEAKSSSCPSTKAKDGSENDTGESDPTDRLEALVQSLVEIISDLPVIDSSYGLHNESVNMLVILLSSTLVSNKPAFQSRFWRCVVSSDKPVDLIRALVNNFVENKPAPASYMSEEGGSLVLGIASGMWNILTLGYSSVAQSGAIPENEVISTTPLTDSSVILLLILTNHCSDANGALVNPYRKIIFHCSNSKDKTDADESSSLSLDFGKLFKSLCSSLSADESTLLLYVLLHQNSLFRTHILASSDAEMIVLPILKTLYNAPESSNHHIYMSLIVLLILSEDDLFNTSVHDITMKSVDWYTERSLHEISLGGLLILVVIRTIQYNMLKMRDKYLHTNCLAALANMSSQFKNLHPYVSQRIVSMFETLAKKHSRLVNTLQHSGEIEEEDNSLSEVISDVSVLEEVLRMILEIINSCLVNQIKNNSNLIYTLLYKKELFQPFVTHPTFQDLCQNLQTVISYFHSRLEQIQEKKERTLAVYEVQEVIRQTAMQFPREKLTKFPDLKFKYVEEDRPEDFFVPYIWTLAGKRIYWNPKYVQLFANVD